VTATTELLIYSADPSTADQLAQRVMSAARHVHQAHTAEKALARLNTTLPDAVLVHLRRDRQDGISLVRRIHRQYPELVILAVGNHKDPDVILSGLRAGISDYLPLEENGQGLSAALLSALDRRSGSGAAGRLIAVFSLKGGQGVTTTAVNLADHIHLLTGRRVLLADLNLYRGDAADYLNQNCGYTPFQLVRDLQRMDEHLLFSSLIRHKNRFYLLGTSSDISDADQIATDDLAGMITLLKRHFDTIVTDMPSDCSEKNLAALEAADTILLVVQQTIPEIKSLQSVVGFFREINLDTRKVKIIINRYSKTSDLTAPDLEGLVGCPVAATITSDYKAITHAIDQGKTLATACPERRINRDFRDLASRLTGIDGSTANRRPLFGTLSKWIKGS
jgi:pilus assembly protein CpaE